MLRIPNVILCLYLFSVLLSAQQALQLTNQTFVEVPADSSLNPGDEITVEMWIMVDSLISSQHGIAGTWDDNNGSFRTYAFWIFNEKVEFLLSRTNFESPRVFTFQVLLP